MTSLTLYYFFSSFYLLFQKLEPIYSQTDSIFGINYESIFYSDLIITYKMRVSISVTIHYNNVGFCIQIFRIWYDCPEIHSWKYRTIAISYFCAIKRVTTRHRTRLKIWMFKNKIFIVNIKISRITILINSLGIRGLN